MVHTVQLEKFTIDEIPTLLSWIPNKEFLIQWAGTSYTFPLTAEQLINDMKKMEEQPPSLLRYDVRTIAENIPIGHIQLVKIDYENRSARIGRVLIGKPDQRNTGACVQMVHSILEIAFAQLHLHRVDLGVFDFNKPAIACYQHAGFHIEGALRDYRRVDDTYWTVLNMSILEDEYWEKRIDAAVR